MAVREQLEVGNNVIEAEVYDELANGYNNGYLYYYDTNYQLPRPLTTKSIYTSMTKNLFDKRETAQWNAGFVFGWITALYENNPAFFFSSIVISECVPFTEPLPIITLQEALASNARMGQVKYVACLTCFGQYPMQLVD